MAHGDGMSETAIASLPGSLLIAEYAPQPGVARASLTITHGGLHTVLDSPGHGVPIAALFFEQPASGD